MVLQKEWFATIARSERLQTSNGSRDGMIVGHWGMVKDERYS